ncbi:MAG: glycosyltransferase family 4 protein [Bacteroidetes bacterium]|nr:glycosyltransferase family 4 protein [Bacteroidota bacterium]
MEQGKKIKALLIASCRPGVIGGQATSARLLLSGLKNEMAWRVVALPVPGQQILLRIASSLRVFCSSFFICLTGRIQVVHIFASCTRLAMFEKLVLGYFLRLTGSRTILNFRGAFDEFYRQCSAIEKKMVCFFLKHQSIVLCQHCGIKTFLLQEGIVSENKIRVIANAVEHIGMSEIDAIKTGKQKILCLSWIVSSKGLDLLIDAASEIKSELMQQNAVIEICGPEEEQGLKAKLQRKINTLLVNDVIYFSPPVSGREKYILFRESIMFVFPTRKEGFPNALLEAMMFGLPVVTTNQSPMNELVHDQLSGLLFERENKADLAKQILILLKDESRRKQMGIEGRKIVLENFTIEKVMSRFLSLYNEVVS